MNAAEIVMDGVQGNSMAKVIDFFGERIGEPGEAAHLHSHREVLALHVACGNVAGVGPAGDCRSHRTDAFCGAVPPFVFRRHSIEFNQRCVVDVRAERTLNSVQVCPMPVRGELDSIGDPRGQVLHESISGETVTVSHKIRNNQFAIRIDGDPCPRITITEDSLLFGRYVYLFGIAELPDFITLHAARPDAPHGAVVKLRTCYASILQQRENRTLRNTSHTAGSANGIAFHECRNDGYLLGERKSVHERYYA